MNTTQKVYFCFSKLRYGPFGLNPENFANIWQIEWSWIRSMKFQWVKWIFSLLSSKNVATMATWRNDFFSLLLRNKQLVIKKKPRERVRGASKTEGDLIIFLPWKGRGLIEKGGLYIRCPVSSTIPQVKLAILLTERNTDYEPQWELKRRYTVSGAYDGLLTVSNEISRHNRCTLLERIYTFPCMTSKLTYRTGLSPYSNQHPNFC